jgi:imidazolonepropionase-like amidohydrolase
MLRQELVRAREYAAKREAGGEDAPGRDLHLEALAAVLAGERPLLVAAHRAHDISAALRVAEEFDLRMVLDGGAESYLLIDRLKAAGVPVLTHAPMVRAGGERENASMETAHLLQQAGLQVALQSGYESYVPRTRVVLFEAAIAARYGCSFDEALRLVTIDAARILGIGDRLGSLEPGKDADLALYDGDPFEYTTHCLGVVIDGVPYTD